MKLFVALILSYLIGSIPFAYMFGRMLQGIDIRQHGSGNVGATNVFRVLGKKAGWTVLCLDILKGFVAVAWVADGLGLVDVTSRLLIAVAVVCGHNWTIFLGFKGGKGIATSLGVLLALAVKIPSVPPVLLMTLGAWILVFLFFRIVSLASIAAAVVFPIAVVLTSQPLPLIALAFLFSIFIIFRHRQNISRLFRGVEPRVPLWKRPQKPSC